MKFKITINGGNEVLLTTEQVEAVANALYGGERVVSKFVKDANGSGGYIQLLAEPSTDAWFTPSLVTDEMYGALKFMTEMQRGK